MSQEVQEEKKVSEEKEKPEQKPAFSDATPAGLVALAVACFCYFALLTGIVDGPQSMPLVGCWLLGGFLVQFTVAMIDLKNGNLGGGNTFLYFSAFFMLSGAVSMFIKGGVFGDIAVSPKIDGMVWIALGITVLLWTPAFFKAAGQLFLICVFLCLAIPFLVLNDFGAVPAAAQAFGIIAGSCLLICGLLGLWLAAATIVNKAYGRTVYPTLKPFYKPKNKK